MILYLVKALFIISLSFYCFSLQLSMPDVELTVFSQYLNLSDSANNFSDFSAETAEPPIYSFNYYTFYDQNIEHRTSPYNLELLAKDTSSFYTCLDSDKILMFDNDGNFEVDTEAKYFGYIEANGEFQNHEKLSTKRTKLFLYETNYLVYLLFKMARNKYSTLELRDPLPFTPSLKSKYRILNPDHFNSGPIPHSQVKNDLEALMLNYQYYRNKSETQYGDLYWKRFGLVSSYHLQYISGGNVRSKRYELSQKKNRDVETVTLALMLMYYSDKVYRGSFSSDDLIVYVSLRSKLRSIQQIPPNYLTPNQTKNTAHRRGGWLKYMDPLHNPNPINIKASVLSLYALGMHSYLTYEPFLYPMYMCYNGISQSGDIYGYAYAYLYHDYCSRMIWGPYVTLPSGRYRFYYTFSKEYYREPSDLNFIEEMQLTNRGSDNSVQFEVYYDGGVRHSNYYRNYDSPNPSYSYWRREYIEFYLSSEKSNVEFRVWSNHYNKLISTFKIIRV